MLRAKNTVQRELSACVEEHFNDFNLVKKITKNSISQLYRSIDILYMSASDINQIINCAFVVSMRNTYQVVSNKTKNSLSITTADQCYGCNKFFIERKSLERHMNVCGYFSGIVYKFENQNIQAFFDNMKFMGDLLFSIYFDLETTASKKVYFDEGATLHPISYAFVTSFHLSLNIEKISVVRSFNHTFEQLNDVSYLKVEILPFVDPITTRQLKDCAAAVFTKKQKYSLSKMFSCELKFVIGLLKKWLAEKFFNRYKELDMFTKQRFKRQNPINWESTNCAICGFRLPSAGSNFPNEKITTFLDFVIVKKFFRQEHI